MEQREEEPETSSAREKPREVDPTFLKDLSCSICLSLFTDPVVLQCGHSFCQTCVHEYWEKNSVRECSLCKQLIPEGDPPINFSLKSLCEKYGGRSQGEPSGGNRNHTETFQTAPENIREKQEALKEDKQLCDSSIERIKTQIMEVLKKKRTRGAALRKGANLKNHLMHEKIKNKSGQGKRFIGDCKPDMKRMRRPLRNLWKTSKAKTHFSKHLENLQLEVSKKMGNDIKKTGTDNGHEKEHLSVLHMMNDKRQLFPGNPECSTHCEQNQERNLKRRRVEQDSENGNVSVHGPDNNTSILTHEQTFTQSPVDDFSLSSEESEYEDQDVMHVPVAQMSSSEEFEYEDQDVMYVPVAQTSHPPRHEESLFLLELNGGSSAAQVTPGPVCSANKDLPHSADVHSGD